MAEEKETAAPTTAPETTTTAAATGSGTAAAAASSPPAPTPATPATPAAAPAAPAPSQAEPESATVPLHQAALAVHEDWENEEEPVQDDGDSALGTVGATSTTASVTSSILEYRTFQGRTYHSDRHNSNYFTPNDERQGESVDITHHYLTLLLDNKLYLAPLKPDIQKVLDIGTGTGIWAIDFADEFPNAQVIGTDLSPTQPEWVPPNLKFELDDCTKEWTWAEDSFDFVHIRYLFGAVADWDALFVQAFRTCKHGGWVQSCEADVAVRSDDGSLSDDTAMVSGWTRVFHDGGVKLGRSFQVIKEDLQVKGMRAAGFVDIQTADYKVPIGAWPRDVRLREVGQYVQLTMENDMEGYTLFLWDTLLGWDKAEYQVFLMRLRKEIRQRSIHAYFTVRYVWGRKPE